MKIGAYGIERDYSHYVAQAAKTVFAVVGTASKGPIGEATICTSPQDLVNKFGMINPSHLGLYAGQYFLSQSSKFYFVRAASKGAIESSVKIPGANASDSPVTDAITIAALDPGSYSEGYTIDITAGNSVQMDQGEDPILIETYNITLKNKLGVVLERLQNISLDTLTASHTVVEGENTEIVYEYKSNFIKVIAHNPLAVTLAIGQNVSYRLTGGIDGAEDITAADYITAANALSSDLVDMNIFAVPGVSDESVIVAMLALAETRGDCLFLVDPPKGLDRDGVVKWHNGIDPYDHAAFNSSYGALYYDWCTIYDSVNKVKVDVPPSVLVATSYAYSDRTSEVWYAPAGLKRGIIRGALESVTHLNKSDVEYLYSSDENNYINSIYEDPQVGLVLWGQKTLSRENTALNRVNVRRLLNYLKRVVVAACNYLTFDPNDRVTWNSFDMKVRPILQDILHKRGIYEFRIVKGTTIVTDNDIDNYRMPCMVLIRPTKSAEEIPIYFTITSTGADFNTVLEENGIVNI